MGLLTLNALSAVDGILIPLQPHFLPLQGFSKLLQTVDLVNKRINPKLKVKEILLCMYNSRASLPGEVKADIEKFLTAARETDCAWSNAVVLPVNIRRNIKLAEAPSYGKTIFEYEQNCHGAEDYRKVADLLAGKKEEPTIEAIEEPAEETTQEPIEVSDLPEPTSVAPIEIVEIKPVSSESRVSDFSPQQEPNSPKANYEPFPDQPGLSTQ